MSDVPGGFRAQLRFSDPMAPVPVEWTAPTPPEGTGPLAVAPPVVDAAPHVVAPAKDPQTDAAQAPSTGWRKWVHRGSAGLINPGESPKVVRHNTLAAQVRQPLPRCYRIAMLSQKGGVGKTTITATLGATFASTREDRVIAVDANPDRGTLSQKVPLETPATVRHLLRDAEGISSYEDVRQYTSQGPSRLEVLASESDPAVSEAFSAEDYSRAVDVLDRFYSVMLTDCGTGMLHSAMSAVIAKADILVVVSSGSVDGSRSASATLDWLDAHGHEDRVRSAIAVINGIRPKTTKGAARVDLDKVVDHFARRCAAVCKVPFDPHLEEGAEISLDRLRPDTRESLLELAAQVALAFPTARRATGPVG